MSLGRLAIGLVLASQVVSDPAVRRLDPSAFPLLPATVQQDMIRRGCTIPQPSRVAGPVNVIRGAFTAPQQTDWAVLCSRGGRSSILVFPNGSTSGVLELAARDDADALVEMGPGTLGYMRQITTASPSFIREHQRRYGGAVPPLVTHDGIDDAWLEKASVVWYWDAGAWLALTGSD